MQVIIYSTTTCPYCKMLKDYLDGHNVSYEEKLIDQDEAAKEQMVSNSDGFMGVPFTVITKDDGEKEKIVGFDKGKIDKVLEIN
jgi:glutaredoxin